MSVAVAIECRQATMPTPGDVERDRSALVRSGVIRCVRRDPAATVRARASWRVAVLARRLRPVVPAMVVSVVRRSRGGRRTTLHRRSAPRSADPDGSSHGKRGAPDLTSQGLLSERGFHSPADSPSSSRSSIAPGMSGVTAHPREAALCDVPST